MRAAHVDEDLMNNARSEAAERILAAALRLFAEKATSARTISDISGRRRALARLGALYKHYHSKEALLVAIVDRYVAAARARSPLSRSRAAAARRHCMDRATGTPDDGRATHELRIFWRDLEQFPELQQRVAKV